MNCKKTITLVLAVIIIVLTTTCWAKDDSIGITLPADCYVLDKRIADLTGDQVDEEIYLAGQRDKNNDNYCTQLQVIVINGKSKHRQTVSLSNLGGYQPKLLVGDFNGDKVSDVLIAVPAGGSGGLVNYRIISLHGTNAAVIFDHVHNSGVKFHGKLLSGFKAELINDNTGKTVVIDISSNKSRYIEEKIYDEQGGILRQVQPYAYPFSLLEAIDIDHDGTYELRGYQRIIGAYGADTISNVVSVWRYSNVGWEPIQIEVSSFLVKFTNRPVDKVIDEKSNVIQQIKQIDQALPKCRTSGGQRGGGDFLAIYTAYYYDGKLVYVEENQDFGEYGLAVVKYYFSQGRLFAYERKGRLLISAGNEQQILRPVSITLYFDKNKKVICGYQAINGSEAAVQDSYVKEALAAADQLKAHLNIK